MERVVFARTGHMKYYQGPQVGDEKPVGGGSYNQKALGHESFNFKPVNGRLYGYFQPFEREDLTLENVSINLERIDPAVTGDYLDNVTIIMIARKPDNSGQFIVGWYKKARLHRTFVESTKVHQRNHFFYCIDAPVREAVLLPENMRTFVPFRGGQKDAMGRANIFYPYDERPRPRSLTWINKAVNYVNSYDGPNLLVEPEYDAEKETTIDAEKNAAKSSGQAFNSSVEARKKIEEYSMQKAKRYFLKKGYTFVEDRSKNFSFDLEFVKNSAPLYVEVKGTQTNGATVFLTKNEVAHCKKNREKCALYILHSIKLTNTKKSVRCSGGVEFCENPWNIQDKHLVPITFQYKVQG